MLFYKFFIMKIVKTINVSDNSFTLAQITMGWVLYKFTSCLFVNNEHQQILW